MTPMEKQIIVALIEDWAVMIGLELQGTDMQDILDTYIIKKRQTHDIQTILLDALYSIQEERVGKSSLVLT